MRSIITLFIFFCATQLSYAQLNLTAASYTATVAGKKDTLINITTATIPANPKGTNQLWDFSAAVTSVTANDTFFNTPAGSSFTSAQYVKKITEHLGYYNIPSTIYYGVSSAGIMAYGKHYNKQVISIDSVTGNTADTMTIYEQDVPFTTPQKNIAFPATYLSTWNDTVSTIIRGDITAPVLSMNHAPLEIHSIYTQYDTVTGWGTIKMKNSLGVVKDISVLQVRSLIARIDSAFINGVFITVDLMHYFWVPRGFYSYSYKYSYYTANEVTPLADVDYDFSYTTPSSARLLYKSAIPNGISILDNKQGFIAYPNPVSHHKIFIDTKGNNGKWAYALTDISGKQVTAGTLLPNDEVAAIDLPGTITPGTYYLQVSSDEGVQISVQQVLVY